MIMRQLCASLVLKEPTVRYECVAGMCISGGWCGVGVVLYHGADHSADVDGVAAR